MNHTLTKWTCNICGYIHQGDSPPDFCPICGASKNDFSPLQEKAVTPEPAPTQWQCLNCNHVAQGEKPPAECPVCGVTQERFLPLPSTQQQIRNDNYAPDIVIIGGGIAGISAAESIRNISDKSKITIIAKEAELPYYRLNLTRFLSGDVDNKDLDIHDKDWFIKNNISLLNCIEADRILPDKKHIILSDGRSLPFDKLIIATGAHPFIPAFPGVNKAGVMVLRSRQDAQKIISNCHEKKSFICIGGGVLGIETAGALARRGMQVTLLESHEWIMPRQLNQRAGEILARHIKETGVDILLNSKTKEIVGDEKTAGVLLQDGNLLHADHVIITTGVRPNSYLARLAGLEVNHGIVVDSHLKTSHADIYAAGDICEHNGVLYGNWSAAQYQGSIAGLNAMGIPTAFGGIPRSNTLKILDLGMVSIGKFQPEDGSYLILEEESDSNYKRLIIRDNILVGAVLLGDTSTSQYLKKSIESKQAFAEHFDESTTIDEVLTSLQK